MTARGVALWPAMPSSSSPAMTGWSSPPSRPSRRLRARAATTRRRWPRRGARWTSALKAYAADGEPPPEPPARGATMIEAEPAIPLAAV